jgi:hypothetical protein
VQPHVAEQAAKHRPEDEAQAERGADLAETFRAVFVA